MLSKSLRIFYHTLMLHIFKKGLIYNFAVVKIYGRQWCPFSNALNFHILPMLPSFEL